MPQTKFSKFYTFRYSGEQPPNDCNYLLEMHGAEVECICPWRGHPYLNLVYVLDGIHKGALIQALDKELTEEHDERKTS